MADNATREMHEAVDKVIAEKKKEPIGTKEAEQEVAADLNEAAHRDTQGGQENNASETPEQGWKQGAAFTQRRGRRGQGRS